VVEETCNRNDAKLVVVARDVRAVELLRKALPPRVDELVTVIDGSRHADGSEDAIADDTVRAVATVVARDTAALLAKFREEVGQHDRAADGPGPVLEALARGQVEVLLVHDDPDDNRTAWFGPEPLHVGARRDVVEAMGVAAPTEGRLVDVALRAALGSGAGIRIVPDSRQLDGRVGAILRWAD
jgi:peptide subunit release factor 1 (eRF1)